MKIFELGFRQSHLTHLSSPDQIEHVARIVFDSGHQMRVDDGTSSRLVHLAGRIQRRPAVGDFVVLRDELIMEVVPRTNALTRRAAGSEGEEQILAANIDCVALVEPLDGPPNLRRLERGITLARASQAAPLIVLTKADLVDDAETLAQGAAALAPDAHVVVTSSLEGEVPEALTDLLEPASTTVFIGASGAGKSTLVNLLLGASVMATTPVREFDQKGRHTTTARHLLRLPGGGLLIDTPGTRELGLIAEEDDVADAFDEVRTLAEHCRFRDCSHQDEPGCAVLEAVARGDLEQKRLDSFHKQVREARHTREKQHDHLRRAREKGFARMVDEVMRHKGRR